MDTHKWPAYHLLVLASLFLSPSPSSHLQLSLHSLPLSLFISLPSLSLLLLPLLYSEQSY